MWDLKCLMNEVVYFSDTNNSPCFHSSGYVQKHLNLFKEDWKNLNLVDARILQDLELPANKDNPDPLIRACHHLLWGMFHHQDGDMLQGYLFLMEAERVLELTHQVHGDSIPKNDFFSYGLLEIASFFYRLFDIKNTRNYIQRAQSFAHSNHLKVITATFEQAFSRNLFFMDVIAGDMSVFDEGLEYMRQNRLDYALVKALFLRKSINITLGQMDATFDNYFEGMGICQKLGLDTFQSGFHLALGVWYAKNKEWQKALKCYQEAYEMSESHYRQLLCFENTASLYERYNPSHNKRIEALMKMLEKAEKHNIMQKIPVVCLYLGHYYREEKQDLEMARYYMKKGYDAAMDMQEQGIHLFSRSAHIAREYPEFMEKYYLPWISHGQKTIDVGNMAFCLDKDWKQCKNTFQYSLIIHHLTQGKSVSELLSHLDLKLCTFQAIRKKLISAGFDIPDFRYSYAAQKKLELDPQFAEYCQSVTEQNWKEANLCFQKDALNALIKHHNNNKMQLSKQLKISYPTMLKMFKDIV